MREAFARVFRILALILVGAGGMLVYLEWGIASVDRHYRNELSTIQFLLFTCVIIAQLLDRQQAEVYKDPSPAWSASSVIILTGCAAAFSVWNSFVGKMQIILPVLIVLGTLLVATAAFRFAKKNADQIGEAQFLPKS